ERAHDRLADPPDRVRGEARAPLGLVLLDGAEQAEITLLDQVGKRQSAVRVAAGDLDDEAQVGLDQPRLRLLVTRADPASQRLLLLAREARDPRDLPEVDAQVRATRLARLLADVRVPLVRQRVERRVRNDLLGVVTHRPGSRPSPRRARCGAGAAAGRA